MEKDRKNKMTQKLVTSHEACLDEMKSRTLTLQEKMREHGVTMSIFTDEDSLFYYTGLCNHQSLKWGFPVILLVPSEGEPSLVVVANEAETARVMGWISNIHLWEYGKGREWLDVFRGLLPRRGASIGVERFKSLRGVLEALRSVRARHRIIDITSLVDQQRLIKSPLEIALMREAGQVVLAMVEAGRNMVVEGAFEYDLALAMAEAGTRRAVDFLTEEGGDQFISPVISNLNFMGSGDDVPVAYGHATKKRLSRGDTVYFSFGGVVSFKQYKPGFDRQFWVSEATDYQLATYEVALKAQKACLDLIKPGISIEEVVEATNEVYRSAGHSAAYRIAHSIGLSYLDAPEFKVTDKTVLVEGMTLSIRGGISSVMSTAGVVDKQVRVQAEADEAELRIEKLSDQDEKEESKKISSDTNAKNAGASATGESKQLAYGACVCDSIVITSEGYDSLTPFEKQNQICA